MRLADGKKEGTYTVKNVGTTEPLRKRLEALGITKGARVQIQNRKKKTMMVKIRGCRWALGEEIVKEILVEEVISGDSKGGIYRESKLWEDHTF